MYRLEPRHVLLSVEELAVNDLRETFHHWVRTLIFPIQRGAWASRSLTGLLRTCATGTAHRITATTAGSRRASSE
jgi:hypothetical protein